MPVRRGNGLRPDAFEIDGVGERYACEPCRDDKRVRRQKTLGCAGLCAPLVAQKAACEAAAGRGPNITYFSQHRKSCPDLWGGPLGPRGSPDPLLVQQNQFPARRGRPTRASAADQGSAPQKLHPVRSWEK